MYEKYLGDSYPSNAKKEPLGGYDLIKNILREYGTFVRPGTIYPTLSSLEKEGLIKGSLNAGKRIYRLTDEGERTLKVLLENYSEIQRRILSKLGIKME